MYCLQEQIRKSRSNIDVKFINKELNQKQEVGRGTTSDSEQSVPRRGVEEVNMEKKFGVDHRTVMGN